MSFFHQGKRKKPSITPEKEDMPNLTEEYENMVSETPKTTFLLMEHENEGQTLTSISPFLINKIVLAITKTQPKTLKKLRNGTVLIEANEEHVAALLALGSLGDQVKVTVQRHPTLNAVRGVIKCRVLQGLTDAEILQELHPQGVTEVRCLTKTGAELSRPFSYLLIFSSPSPPNNMEILGEKYRVHPFYPNPYRCFACNRYGHGQPCKNQPICPRCATSHEGDFKECKAPEKCAACGKGHDVRSTECPVFLRERHVLRYSIRNRIPLAEARRAVLTPPDRSRVSDPTQNSHRQAYSDVIKNTRKESHGHSSQHVNIDNQREFPELTQSQNKSYQAHSSNDGNDDPLPLSLPPPPPPPCTTCTALITTVKTLSSEVAQLRELVTSLVSALVGELTPVPPVQLGNASTATQLQPRASAHATTPTGHLESVVQAAQLQLKQRRIKQQNKQKPQLTLPNNSDKNQATKNEIPAGKTVPAEKIIVQTDKSAPSQYEITDDDGDMETEPITYNN